MLKIMEVHPSPNPSGEYVVLQNVGLVTVNMRGCAICTEDFLTENLVMPGAIRGSIYVFRDDIVLKPYMRVVLFTGCGADNWVPTTDGKMAYCAFWNLPQSVWEASEQVHLLQMTATRRVPHPEPTPVTPPSHLTRESRSDDAELTRAELERQRGHTFVCVGETEW